MRHVWEWTQRQCMVGGRRLEGEISNVPAVFGILTLHGESGPKQSVELVADMTHVVVAKRLRQSPPINIRDNPETPVFSNIQFRLCNSISHNPLHRIVCSQAEHALDPLPTTTAAYAFTGPPLAAFKSLLRLVMLPIARLCIPWSISSQKRCTTCQSSSALVGRVGRPWRCFLRTAHMFSIGFRSGEAGG